MLSRLLILHELGQSTLFIWNLSFLYYKMNNVGETSLQWINIRTSKCQSKSHKKLVHLNNSVSSQCHCSPWIEHWYLDTSWVAVLFIDTFFVWFSREMSIKKLQKCFVFINNWWTISWYIDTSRVAGFIIDALSLGSRKKKHFMFKAFIGW